LIINAVFKLRKNAVVDIPTAFIFLAAFILAALTSLPVALLIATAGVCGIVVSMLRKRAPPDDTDRRNPPEGGPE